MDFEGFLPDISGWQRINNHYQREKKEGMPKVTVVIPSSNNGHLIETSIISFSKQKNVEKELIIIDASSQDHTSAVIEKHKQEIARVYYVTNSSLALMINKGFSLATGQYVSFLLPGMEFLNLYCLSHISTIAQEELSPSIIYSATYLAWPSFKKLRHAFQRKLTDVNAEFTLFPLNKHWLMRGFFPSAPSSMWFNKDFFVEVGGLNFKTKSFRKSFFELLCRSVSSPNVRIASTFWSTTYSDHLVEKNYINQKDVFLSWPIIVRYFGIVNGVLWFFRAKPVNFVTSFLNYMASFFRE